MDGEINLTLIPLRTQEHYKMPRVELTTEGFLEETNFDEDFLTPLRGGKRGGKMNVKDDGATTGPSQTSCWSPL